MNPPQPAEVTLVERLDLSRNVLETFDGELGYAETMPVVKGVLTVWAV